MPDRDGPTPESGLPARVSMPLLTLITQQSLDEDYLVAAERRAAGAPRPPRGRPQRTAAVVIAVFGILVSTAFVQTTRSADVNDASRTTLIQRIGVRRDRVASSQERVAVLRDRTSGLERQLTRLTDAEQAEDARNRRLRVRTGLIAVVGEGVRVTVTQRADADAVQQVMDSDLALLANGLWEAGAEAVAINGQRLTAYTAIRSSGPAIEVNGVGIAPPYQLDAVGDTRTLAAKLFDTSTGLEFVQLAGDYGFSYNVDNEDRLTLPAGPARYLQLRSASTDLNPPIPPSPKEIER